MPSLLREPEKAADRRHARSTARACALGRVAMLGLARVGAFARRRVAVPRARVVVARMLDVPAAPRHLGLRRFFLRGRARSARRSCEEAARGCEEACHGSKATGRVRAHGIAALGPRLHRFRVDERAEQPRRQPTRGGPPHMHMHVHMYIIMHMQKHMVMHMHMHMPMPMHRHRHMEYTHAPPC